MNRCARDKIYKCSETLVPAFLETVLLQNEVRIVCLFFKKRSISSLPLSIDLLKFLFHFSIINSSTVVLLDVKDLNGFPSMKKLIGRNLSHI